MWEGHTCYMLHVGCAHRKKNNLREHPQKYLSPLRKQVSLAWISSIK